MLRYIGHFMLTLPRAYTAESVTSGHPDKICDQISDAMLDAYLTQDKNSRVAIECFGGHGHLVIGGEVTTRGSVNAESIARQVYAGIGYREPLSITTHIVRQSPDIAQGVDTGGAGDQGIMYGYATNETPEFLPRATVFAHKLSAGLENLRRNDPTFFWLRPDGKTQVTIVDDVITAIVVSTQHEKTCEWKSMRDEIKKKLVDEVCVDEDISGVRFLFNPTGIFVQGGFEADTGLTGRKIMVDTYGGIIPHGGGAFSGKDATKVDRSAAYMCRLVAKSLVANKKAKQCLVSVAYAIGEAEPVMIEAINENGKSLADIVKEKFDFKPHAIIERLGLRRPIFQKTATYGHFGKAGLPWEEIVEL